MNFTEIFYNKKNKNTLPKDKNKASVVRNFAILNGDKKNINIAVPINSRKVFSSSLTQFRLTKGSRLKPKIIIAVLRLLNFPILYPILFKKRFSLIFKTKKENLLSFLAKKLNLTLGELSFSIYRAPGKFVLPLFNAKTGKCIGYAKIYNSKEKSEYYGENEARSLRYLSNFEFKTAEPPKLLSSEYFGEYLVNIISTKKGLNSFKEATYEHINWVKELADKTGIKKQFKDSNFAKEIRKELNFIKSKINNNNFIVIKSFYDKAIKELDNKEFLFSFVNREFDYHELLHHKDKNLIIDWEHARKDYPPIFDIYNLLLSSSNETKQDYMEKHIERFKKIYFQKDKKDKEIINKFLKSLKISKNEANHLFFLFVIDMLYTYLRMGSHKEREVVIRFLKQINNKNFHEMSSL